MRSVRTLLLVLFIALCPQVSTAQLDKNFVQPDGFQQGSGNVSIGAGGVLTSAKNALHIHRAFGDGAESAPDFPAIRLTYRGPDVNLGPSLTTFGQLAIQPSNLSLSLVARHEDFILRTGADAAQPDAGSLAPRGNVLISSQAAGTLIPDHHIIKDFRSIGFSTTPPGATSFPSDVLRMVIAGSGNVGIGVLPQGGHIGSANPLDLLHIQSIGKLAGLRVSTHAFGDFSFSQLAVDGLSITDPNVPTYELTAIGQQGTGNLVLRNVNVHSFLNDPGFSGDLIITSQKRGGSLRFGTSPKEFTLPLPGAGPGPNQHGFPDVERMVINERGNVIIGAPQSDRAEKLSVHYDLSAGTAQAAPFAALRLSQADPDQNFSPGNLYRSGIVGLAPFDNAWGRTKKGDMVMVTNSGDMVFLNSLSGDEPPVVNNENIQYNRIFAGAIRFMTRPSAGPNNPGHVEQLTILSNGDIGIGNATPIAKLDVNGSLNVVGTSALQGPVTLLNTLTVDGTTGVAGQVLTSRGTGVSPNWSNPTDFGWGLQGNIVTNGAFIGSQNNEAVIFKTNGSERMRLTAAGKLFIGTTNPTPMPAGLIQDLKLAVNGSILAKEVLVRADWADYVFESDYPLMSLDKLEETIGQLGHLPGIPSAKEVELNGVKLGESQAMLLAKIEELTLYVIQLNKQIKHLQSK